MSVLEPWNTDDPQSEQRAGEMGELSDDALRLTLHASRVRFFGAPGGPTWLPTLEDFDDALPRAAMRAKYAFDDRSRTATSDTERTEPPKD